MTIRQIKENRIIKIISNKYFLVFVFFVVWMSFFDENSYLNHRELNGEIDKLENSIDYYEKEIAADTKIIENLKHPDSLEKFAREEYKMKKESEEIFLIEFDTVKE